MRFTPFFFVALAGAMPQFGNNQRFTMLRFGCAQSVIDRIDPLVNPGLAPSPHMHQIAGGNAFNTTMPSTDISKLASCTTCGYSEDLSNYWTANVYFKARNGTYKRVPQVPNRDLFNDKYTGKTTGGFVVYYVSGSKGDVTAFKPGFRMLVGDAANRVSKNRKSQTCFRCYTGPNFGGDNAAPCQDAKLDTEGFPTTPCPGGIRSNILYPTCWDGVNLDSPDHKSHVAYPTNGPALFTGTSTGGACPASHPIRIPQLMLEIVWDTTKFNNKADWPADGSQPFVLSTGDNTGYGQHGDYVFGWKDDSLQKAMDDAKGCMGANCGSLKTQQPADGNKCVVPNRVPEERDGWMTSLPGMEGMPME
ncbi:hypothetical protein COCC4DRAFT_66754 [Bipolaris maydis ATCC 48331]|uniref:DUF1996 domain-containing protein n=2 Tax=Cochliobolus heterostrophus TaxID=5016 RepID=M2UN94_COCH5|nr:uncharacterized protein COCC4DRAFT_66754 [Bipolaris maydis ATCC 48331]EMD89403.1 hypothetical protein COCHEDRAFT_1216133 [Bipolaris maydis C5]KAJ5025032.1 hypothetical protein J3E73DRAFT_397835 [Bipolaris maydis]ENH99111.1 hypothetical protein COCC4DRAFT_66754 [Bipolaris maydis ATCC 48331]KAJ5057254.1 hypothetical protein J3E74DRAFT_439517 [Bipolaris maydis]KAJ6212750.1 hypothetical protein PSV09DRAFT_1216133 [Bipolaris maydis]